MYVWRTFALQTLDLHLQEHDLAPQIGQLHLLHILREDRLWGEKRRERASVYWGARTLVVVKG